MQCNQKIKCILSVSYLDNTAIDLSKMYVVSFRDITKVNICVRNIEMEG